ncbi:MAG: hypothetical protein V8Q71_03295 [Bacilli bacterium]
MISVFLNDYQNNSIISKTKKRFYLFSNIVLIVGIIFFLFIFYKNLSFVDTISIFIFPLIIVILILLFIYSKSKNFSKSNKEEIKIIKTLLNKYKIDINSNNIELLRQIIKENYLTKKASKLPTFYEIISILTSLIAFFISISKEITSRSFIFILVIFLFLFLFKLLFNIATTILELKEKDYEPLYMYLNEILLEKKIKG